MACLGCHQRARVTPRFRDDLPGVTGVTPSAEPAALAQPGTVAMPITPCQCGRVPWLWIIAAVIAYHVLARKS